MADAGRYNIVASRDHQVARLGWQGEKGLCRRSPARQQEFGRMGQVHPGAAGQHRTVRARWTAEERGCREPCQQVGDRACLDNMAQALVHDGRTSWELQGTSTVGRKCMVRRPKSSPPLVQFLRGREP